MIFNSKGGVIKIKLIVNEHNIMAFENDKMTL